MITSFSRIQHENVVGKWVTYWGTEESWCGKDFQIVAQETNPIGYLTNRISFMVPGKDAPVWRTLGPSFSEPFDKPATNATTVAAIDDLLFNPHGETIRTIDNEITRLKARIEELTTAKKVLQSL